MQRIRNEKRKRSRILSVEVDDEQGFERTKEQLECLWCKILSFESIRKTLYNSFGMLARVGASCSYTYVSYETA